MQYTVVEVAWHYKLKGTLQGNYKFGFLQQREHSYILIAAFLQQGGVAENCFLT